MGGARANSPLPNREVGIMTYEPNDPMFDGTSAHRKPDETLLQPKKALKINEPRTPRGFTGWKIYSGNGIFDVTFNDPNMTVQSNVAVSIGEMSTNDSPFLGLANMSVANVAPFGDPNDPSQPRGCRVRVNVAWGSALRFQLMFVWENS
jgi:hypothetical protein